MAEHLVCITFDFDAMSGFIARGMTTPSPISRGEFGAVAAPRILDLLARLGVRSTWCIPGHTIETYPAICAAVHRAGHEIAHHGWTHVPPNAMTREEEDAGLGRANQAIRQLTGRYARGYRSPSWDLSPHSVDLLLAHGFAYDSSMMGHDYAPYRVRRGDVIERDVPAVFGEPTPLVELPVSWSLDDYPVFEFVRTAQTILPGNANASLVCENWIHDFLYMKQAVRDWGVLTYTFHPFVIGRGHRMLALEKLLRALKRGGATFVTMEEAAAEYDRREPFGRAAARARRHRPGAAAPAGRRPR